MAMFSISHSGADDLRDEEPPQRRLVRSITPDQGIRGDWSAAKIDRIARRTSARRDRVFSRATHGGDVGGGGGRMSMGPWTLGSPKLGRRLRAAFAKISASERRI